MTTITYTYRESPRAGNWQEKMADHISGISFVQILTTIKSKVDSLLKELSNEDGAVSLSTATEEKGREVVLRLDKALDDLSELQKINKVCIN